MPSHKKLKKDQSGRSNPEGSENQGKSQTDFNITSVEGIYSSADRGKYETRSWTPRKSFRLNGDVDDEVFEFLETLTYSSWETYHVSPLYAFEGTEVRLKQYGLKLLTYLAKMELNERSDGVRYDARFTCATDFNGNKENKIVKLLFSQENEKHPIVFLKDVKFDEMKAVIDFVYYGEIQIREDCLESFLAIAESLQIKGLNDASESYKARIDRGGTSCVSSAALVFDSSAHGSSGSPFHRPGECYDRSAEEPASHGISGGQNDVESSQHFSNHLDVFSVSEKLNFAGSLGEPGDPTFGETKSASVIQRRTSLNEKLSSEVQQIVKTEPLLSFVEDSKCEQMKHTCQESVHDTVPENALHSQCNALHS